MTSAPTEFSIHPATTLGPVSLTVADLENQVAFYQRALGFHLHWRDEHTASLGAGGADLLQLTEQPRLKRYRGVTGLYHFAVLFPNRRELALAVARLFALRYRNHPTDHVMTKTTYLDDPEGNGIELYAESPEDGTFEITDGEFVTRRTNGKWSDGREPLDVEALFGLLGEEENLDVPLPPETRIGHVHLHVREVAEAVAFYHGVLGFDVMGHSQKFQAAFVSAGGYHHHLGLNTWQGAGAPPPPADAAGLRYFTVQLPNAVELETLLGRAHAAGVPMESQSGGWLMRDPSHNAIVLTISPQ